MRNLKKIAGVLAIVGIMATAGVAYAATAQTPADILAGLTGKTAAELADARADGKTYGAIAAETGTLEEFQAQMLERKKAILDQRVKDGVLTQEQADAILKNIETNMANCDGTGQGRGSCGIGQGNGGGLGFGQGNGQGRGCGMGRGNGGGFGQGQQNSI